MDRQQRIIYLGAGVVLALVAIIILVGIYFTRVLPPQAHVLSVGEQSYNAAEVVDRGSYLTIFEGGVGSATEIARATVDRLVREEVLRRQGPAVVGEVTEDDVRQEMMVRLGLAEPEPDEDEAAGDGDDPDGTATPAPTATPTEAATPTGTAGDGVEATPTEDPEEQFAQAYTDFLRNIDLGRAEFESIVEAQLIARRLVEQFSDEIGDSGEQVHLARIRVSDPALADDLRQQLVDGADIAELADEHSTAEEDEEGGDLGWFAPPLLDDRMAQAVEGLEAGEVSEVTTVGVSFEILKVVERAEDREYEAGMVDRLAAQRLDEWVEEQQGVLTVEEDLSSVEVSWIIERVLGILQEA